MWRLCSWITMITQAWFWSLRRISVCSRPYVTYSGVLCLWRFSSFSASMIPSWFASTILKRYSDSRSVIFRPVIFSTACLNSPFKGQRSKENWLQNEHLLNPFIENVILQVINIGEEVFKKSEALSTACVRFQLVIPAHNKTHLRFVKSRLTFW